MEEVPGPKPIYTELVDRVNKEGSVTVALTMQDAHELFKRQAETDVSGDLPVLLPEFRAEITPNGILHVFAPYTVDADRKPLIIEGFAKNNEKGILTDENGVSIRSDKPELESELKRRVLEAFGVEKLSLPHFIKLIFEDSLGGKAVVQKLWVEGENLGVVLTKAPEGA